MRQESGHLYLGLSLSPFLLFLFSTLPKQALFPDDPAILVHLACASEYSPCPGLGSETLVPDSNKFHGDAYFIAKSPDEYSFKINISL